MPLISPDSILLQLGVGGIFAYIIIKEVLTFLSKKRSSTNGNSGERNVDYWRAEIATAVASTLASKTIPLLEEIKSLQGSNVEIVRARIHDVNNSIQKVIILLELIRAHQGRQGG